MNKQSENEPLSGLRHEKSISRRRLKTWIRLLSVTRRTESKLRKFLTTEHKTTLPRFDVMAALHRQGDPLMMSELSKLLLVSNGNVSMVVDRLESDGLVARDPAKHDRRVIKVALTSKGREDFEVLAQRHEALINEIFEDLDDGDLDTLRDLLRLASPLKRSSPDK